MLVPMHPRGLGFLCTQTIVPHSLQAVGLVRAIGCHMVGWAGGQNWSNLRGGNVETGATTWLLYNLGWETLV